MTNFTCHQAMYSNESVPTKILSTMNFPDNVPLGKVELIKTQAKGILPSLQRRD